MMDLINDVLDMSKITSGKIELRPEVFNSEDFFNGIVDTVSLLAEQNKIQFNHNIQSDFPKYVKADRVRLQQIIMNLLSNAIKYSNDNGWVNLNISSTAESFMEIIVADNGIGMSESFQQHMFEPFAQEHQNRFFNIQGTGLGLSIVKNLVNHMNGTIKVESKLERGTTFTVILPLISVDSITELHSDDKSDVSIEGRHILVVEDNELNAEIFMTILREKEKAFVEWAINGAEGVKKYQDSEEGYFDMILMDLRMPVMDGFTATKAIRSSGRKDSAIIPIIAMTADAFSEDIQRCTAAGMNGHISKPIDPVLFRKTIIQSLLS